MKKILEIVILWFLNIINNLKMIFGLKTCWVKGFDKKKYFLFIRKTYFEIGFRVYGIEAIWILKSNYFWKHVLFSFVLAF